MALLQPVDYGTDLALNRDSFNYIKGTANLARQLVRRLKCRRGTVRWAQDEGMDVRDYINKKMGQDDVDALSFKIKQELERDESVDIASVKLTFNPIKFLLNGQITVTTVYDTSFTLIVSISNLTLELLGIQA